MRVEQVATLVTEELKAMAEGGDHLPLLSKRKAISALLPYAVWEERSGQLEMLDMFLRAARASRKLYYMWHHIHQFSSTLLSKASPRAIVLTSPHIPWYLEPNGEDLVCQWAAAASAVPRTEETTQSVVDTLLQISPQAGLLSHITVDLWLWLTKRPSLPPVCQGRYLGTCTEIIRVARGLKNIEVLKSYLLLAWSEWAPLWGGSFGEMRGSICNDFGGFGMSRHRKDLIQRLDHILKQLDGGLDYLKHHNPYLDEDHLQTMMRQYGELKAVLLEMESSMSPLIIMTMLFHILTLVGIHRVAGQIYLCTSSHMSVVPHLKPSTHPLWLIHMWILRSEEQFFLCLAVATALDPASTLRVEQSHSLGCMFCYQVFWLLPFIPMQAHL